MKKFILMLCLGLAVQAAPPSPCCEQPVPTTAPDAMSIYNLESRWRDQHGKPLQLRDFQGRVVCLAMVYSACRSACPRIVADMQALETDLNRTHPGQVRFVLVSLDPAVDTPARLQQWATRSHLGPAWTLLQGAAGDVLEVSAVLGVKYRRLNATDFAHSNLVSVLDRRGVVVHRQEGLGVDPSVSAAAIRQLLKK